jgi:hypothetical protein
MATVVAAKTHIAIAAAAAASVAVVAWWSADGRDGATAARQEAEELAVPGVEPRPTSGAPAPKEEEEDDAASTRTAAPVPEQAQPAPRAWPPPAHEYELEVLVTDERDLPLAGRGIFAAPSGGTLNRVGETDADGRLVVRFKAFRSGLELDLALRGNEPGPLRRVALSSGRTRIAVRASSSEGAGTPLRMILARADGDESEGGIRIGSEMLKFSLQTTPSSPLESAPQAIADAEGWLTFVEPQLVHVVLESAQPASSFVGEQQVFAVSAETLLLSRSVHLNGIQLDAPQLQAALFRGVTWQPLLTEPPPPVDILGRVVDASGQPLEGVPVLARRPGKSEWTETASDAEGGFALPSLEAGEWELRAGGGQLGRASARLTLLAGEQRTWEARLDRGLELKLRLVDRDDQPLAGWRVEVGDDAFEPCADGTVTDGEGRATIPNVPYGAVRVLARPEDGSGAPPMTIAAAVLGGEEELVFRVDLAAAQATGSLRVELSTREGSLEGAEMRVWREDCSRGSCLASVGVTALPEGGGRHDFEIGGLLPGSYRAEALARGRVPLVVSSIYVAAGEPTKVSLEVAPGVPIEVVGTEGEAWNWSLLLRTDAFEVMSGPVEVVGGATLEIRPGPYDQGEIRAGPSWTLEPSGLHAKSGDGR